MLTPGEVLEHDYLDTRCMLVEIAATLDRYDRALAASGGGAPGDPRREQIVRSLELLAAPTGGADRAQRVLELFSDPA